MNLGLKVEMKTMDDLTGDGSDHEACEECGLCIPCGDCIKFHDDIIENRKHKKNENKSRT